MYDFWIGDINLAPFLLAFTFLVVFPVQLILCCKASKKIIRLIPVIILSFLTAAALIAAVLCNGYDIIFYIVSTIYLAIMLLVCGCAWGIWSVLQLIKRRSKPQ